MVRAEVTQDTIDAIERLLYIVRFNGAQAMRLSDWPLLVALTLSGRCSGSPFVGNSRLC
jgi:hypothetical protein